MTRARRFFALICLCCAPLRLAAAPTNDLCAGAEVIPGSGPFPFYSSIIADVSTANTVGDPPGPSCSATGASHSVWYQFAPAMTALYTLSVSEDTATTVPDTILALYSSAAGCSGPFVPIACNDDSGSLGSALSMTLSAGTTYYAVVWASPFSASLTNGHGAIQLKVSRPVPPVNDNCAGAEVIPGNGPFPYLTAVTDNSVAGSSGDPPAPPCLPSFSRSVWYRFTPGTSNIYTISTCQETMTTDFDTAMAIYAGTCGGAFTNLSCNDDSCGARAAITTSLNAGTTYHIVLWESGTDPYIPGETSIQLRVTGLFPPLVTTIPAANIASTNAVFRGAVNPNGAATTAWFDWGTTTNFTLTTPPQLLGGATTNIFVSASQSLPTTQTYFFRIHATNVLGTSLGTNLDFTWVPIRPMLVQPTISSGSMHLQFSGAVHQTYLILTSANLTTWSLFSTAVDNGNGAFTFQDPLSPIVAKRFYRVLVP